MPVRPVASRATHAARCGVVFVTTARLTNPPSAPQMTNHRLPAAILLLATASLVARPTVAAAQSLPDDARQAADAGQYRTQIDSILSAQAERFATGDARQASEARRVIDDLLPAGAETSSSYREEVARAVVAALEPVTASSGAGPFGRMNVAIAVSDVADRTGSPRLLSLVEPLLNDGHPGVAIWGIKAARPLLAESIRRQVGNDAGLPAQIVDAAKRFPRQGELAQQAYETLKEGGGGSFNPDRVLDGPTLQRVAPAAAGATIDLMESRVLLFGPPLPKPETPTPAPEGEETEPAEEPEVEPQFVLPRVPPMPLAETGCSC